MQNYLQKGCKNALTIHNLLIFNRKLVKKPFCRYCITHDNARGKTQLSSQSADYRALMAF